MTAADIIVDQLAPAISPALMARAQGIAATWAATLPPDIVWHEALNIAGGADSPLDTIATILSGNEGASDFEWDCDACNAVLPLTGWLLAEAFYGRATTAGGAR